MTTGEKIETTEEKIEEILQEMPRRFRTMGGGKEVPGNPIAAAVKDRPMFFCSGVEVEEVVRFVASKLKR